MRTIAALLCMTGTASGAEILVLSSGVPEFDQAVTSALEDGGHQVVIGPKYWQLDAGTVIGGFDAVYVQVNAQAANGDMPAGGQEKLLDYLDLGGGIVLCEWTMWKVAVLGDLSILEPALPLISDGTYHLETESTYAQVTSDPVLGAGLPESFSFPNHYLGGTETFVTPKAGATEFYSSHHGDAGVVGWDYSAGRVLQISVVAGPASFEDDHFRQLMANAMTWAADDVESICPVDCNNDLRLDILDFVCFQELFAGQDDAADVNGDGVLNILDFVTFQSLFQQGCV